jgi:hypothetical protein
VHHVCFTTLRPEYSGRYVIAKLTLTLCVLPFVGLQNTKTHTNTKHGAKTNFYIHAIIAWRVKLDQLMWCKFITSLSSFVQTVRCRVILLRFLEYNFFYNVTTIWFISVFRRTKTSPQHYRKPCLAGKAEVTINYSHSISIMKPTWRAFIQFIENQGPQLILYVRNILNAVCVAPPKDEQVMLETCRGPWFSINWMKSA